MPAGICSRTAAAGRPPRRCSRQSAGAAVLAVRARHGVPSFPDPDSTGRIPDPASVGINQGSPKFQAANQACAEDRPPYIPSNSAYDAYSQDAWVSGAAAGKLISTWRPPPARALGGDRGVVGVGDRPDDREAETEAARAGRSVLSRRWNGWKSRSSSPAGIVGPVFATVSTA